MRNPSIGGSLVVILSPLLTACLGGSSEEEQIGRSGVFADDGRGIAVATSVGHESYSFDGAESWYLDEWSLSLADDLDADRTPLLDDQLEAPEAIYYMRQAGYVLLSGVSSSGGAATRIGLDGQRSDVPQPFGSLATDWYTRVVPSPDGGTLALVYNDIEHDQVAMLDASTFDPTLPPTDVPAKDLAPQWTSDSRLIVATFYEGAADPQAFWIHDDGEVTPIDPPACLAPATTSSEVSADGRVLEWHAGSDEFSLGTDRVPAFGCADF